MMVATMRLECGRLKMNSRQAWCLVCSVEGCACERDCGNILSEFGQVDALPSAQVEFLIRTTMMSKTRVRCFLRNMHAQSNRGHKRTPFEMGMVREGPTRLVLVFVASEHHTDVSIVFDEAKARPRLHEIPSRLVPRQCGSCSVEQQAIKDESCSVSFSHSPWGADS